MANPDVGRVDCPQCGKDSPVRWQKGVVGTKLYYACKNCGQFFPRMDGGQAWITANMRPIEAALPEPTRAAESKESEPPKQEDNIPSAWDKFWNGGDQ